MRKIYAIGEALLDIIFKDGHPQTAKAGGSMLNSTVSLGRIGLPVSFISEFGADEVGELINKFLVENGVDTSYVKRYDDGNTALALAFLDENNEAHYTFYKDYPAERLNLKLPLMKSGDVLLCGSFYSIASELRDKFTSIMSGANKAGSLVIYDPNFRSSHLHQIEILKPMIIENMQMASLVRGSDSDFANICDARDEKDAWEFVSNYCQCMVYTANEEGVFVRTTSFSGSFPVIKLTPVSTIGAGDSFNAGIIASFIRDKIFPGDLDKLDGKAWEKVIATAVDFASHVCISYDNYIDLAFARRYLSASRLQI